MLWLKAFHVVFMVTWFAALFYLPRLFVYHVAALAEGDAAGNARFKVMERKLFIMMTLGAALTTLFGVATLAAAPWWISATWLPLKLVLVLALYAYHYWCWRLVVAFREDRNVHGDRWYRWFNEAPSLLLLGIVVLVVVKPF
jgi:protoporphyrinogen IX oxidase